MIGLKYSNSRNNIFSGPWEYLYDQHLQEDKNQICKKSARAAYSNLFQRYLKTATSLSYR